MPKRQELSTDDYTIWNAWLRGADLAVLSLRTGRKPHEIVKSIERVLKTCRRAYGLEGIPPAEILRAEKAVAQYEHLEATLWRLYASVEEKYNEAAGNATLERRYLNLLLSLLDQLRSVLGEKVAALQSLGLVPKAVEKHAAVVLHAHGTARLPFPQAGVLEGREPVRLSMPLSRKSEETYALPTPPSGTGAAEGGGMDDSSSGES